MGTEHLTKLHVDLPNHWGTGGESIWAVDLGNDLYEIRNTPFYAYGLNFGDVVLATADSPDLKPEIRKVERRSGNQTLRLFFAKDVDPVVQRPRLDSLRVHHVSYERCSDRLVALDLEPGADIDDVRDILDAWTDDGLAEYETCEERIAGGFDARPEDDD